MRNLYYIPIFKADFLKLSSYFAIKKNKFDFFVETIKVEKIGSDGYERANI